MKLSKITAAIALVAMGVAAIHAQETCPLPVMVAVDNADGVLSEKNVKALEGKLRQIVTYRGIGSNSELSHLCLKASVSESGDKQVIAGTRPVVSGSFDVRLVLTNLLSGEDFGAAAITVSGAGTGESQMLQGAMARISTTDGEVQRFMQNSRVKVFDYYTAHIPSIISRSAVYSRGGDYDKALYLLATVPPCVRGYDSVADAMLSTYQEALDVDCNRKLTAAQSLWSSTQNEEGAKEAAAILASIDRRSACYEESRELLREIAARVDENLRRIILREDEDRALQQELVRGEADLRRRQQEYDHEERLQEIEAIRQQALAYAQIALAPKLGGDEKPADQERHADDDGKKNGAPVIIVNN